MDIGNHPTREQLIEAAQSGSDTLAPHLAQCEDCRLLFSLLTRFQVAGEVELPSAPAAWINRAAAIVEGATAGSKLRRLVGKLTFDSWSAMPALQVRGTATDERRLRVEAESILLDLRAEHQPNGWQFIARVVGDVSDSRSWKLHAAGQTVYPDERGYFIWNDQKPPQTIVLETGSLQIEVEQLSWTRHTT
ncbi:hypothetical protein KQH82_02230 [bacterium]|nr:hypothetical protein [bacterium]